MRATVTHKNHKGTRSRLRMSLSNPVWNKSSRDVRSTTNSWDDPFQLTEKATGALNGFNEHLYNWPITLGGKSLIWYHCGDPEAGEKPHGPGRFRGETHPSLGGVAAQEGVHGWVGQEVTGKIIFKRLTKRTHTISPIRFCNSNVCSEYRSLKRLIGIFGPNYYVMETCSQLIRSENEKSQKKVN